MNMFRKTVWHIVHPISCLLTDTGIRMNWRWLFNMGGGLECWADEFYWGKNWAEEEAKRAAREQEVADIFAYWTRIEEIETFLDGIAHLKPKEQVRRVKDMMQDPDNQQAAFKSVKLTDWILKHEKYIS